MLSLGLSREGRKEIKRLSRPLIAHTHGCQLGSSGPEREDVVRAFCGPCGISFVQGSELDRPAASSMRWTVSAGRELHHSIIVDNPSQNQHEQTVSLRCVSD